MSNFRNIKIDESLNIFNKKVIMNLVGQEGNAFNLMGIFNRNATKQGWTKEEINYVIHQCMSSDYDHLLCVLMRYTEEEENPEIIYHNGEQYRKV